MSLILATTSLVLFFGIIAPGGAYTVSRPSLAFAAPQTTFLISLLPTSTSQTLSLSALGCFSVFIIFATLNKSNPSDKFSILSTSRPMSVSFSRSLSYLALIFK